MLIQGRRWLTGRRQMAFREEEQCPWLSCGEEQAQTVDLQAGVQVPTAPPYPLSCVTSGKTQPL